MLQSAVLVAALFAAHSLAAPAARAAVQKCTINPTSASPPRRCNPSDPPYLQAESAMYNNINCNAVSGGIKNVKKPYLLVPGTGATGKVSWDDGSYLQLLPPMGYDVCYLIEPQAMDNDAQQTDERIAYALNTLATISGKPVIVQGWSQGNLDIQWVLTFWKSAVANTDRFISLAGDFRGTSLIALVNIVTNTINGANVRRDLDERQNSGLGAFFPVTLPPSVRQQLTGSNYLKALAAHGGLQAKVPTTSIYSLTDDVISPEDKTSSATSYLSGAGNHLIQNYCPGLAVSHGDEIFVAPVFAIVKQALASPSRFATPNQVKAIPNFPCTHAPAPGLTNPIKGDQAILAAALNIVKDSDPLVGGTLVEPPVRAYARS